MRLLASAIPRFRWLVRTNGWFTFWVFLLVGTVEVVGRKGGSDLHDALAAGLLTCAGFVIAVRHRHAPLPWLAWLLARGRSLLAVADGLFKLELGLDLRGRPPIPRRMPKGTFLLFFLLTAWLGTACAAWLFLPQGWRSIGVHVFYIGYLLGLMGVWLLLMVTILVGVYFPLSQMQQLLAVGSGGRFLRAEVLAGATYLGLVVFAHAFLPVSLVLGFCGVALLAALAVMLVADAGQEQFIWRSGSGEPVWSVPSVRLVMACCAAVLLTLAALIVTAAGARVLGRPEAAAAMPVTSLLGSAAAWLTPGIVTAGAALLIQLWWHNPARGRRPVLYVEGGPLLEANRGRVRSAVRARGWRPSWQVPGDSATNVAVALTAPEASEAREFDPRWPLRVSVEDLEEGEVFERLDRRREIQFRRHLCRGLERLFKIAAGQRYRNGTGYWLAPHLWFLAGLTRDEQEQTAEREDARLWMPPIGPPYFRLFHRDARHYLYRVLRALEIDLFFVEDGVTHRNLVRVVRALFEAYDRSGGRRRAEEILFQGLPRVRVMIHDFHIDQPFRSEVYPEPRFEDLGRARILHIFRDRGEHEEPVEPPGDFSRSPAPVLVG